MVATGVTAHPRHLSGLDQGGPARAPDVSSPVDIERARLIAAVHRWVADHGRPPRVIDWDPAQARIRGRPDVAERFERVGTWPKFATVRRHFGGLGGLLRAAGHPAPVRRPRRYRVEWTGDEILAAIRRWRELYGDTPTMADWDPYRARVRGELWRIERYEAGDWPSAKSVRNHFGRLSEAVASAGLVPRRQGQRRTAAKRSVDPEVMLHVAAVRALDDQRSPSLRLAEAVKRVATARAGGEPGDLRIALVEVAAAAMNWAAGV
jgi:hypothetical protein